jgi:adenylate cyclase
VVTVEAEQGQVDPVKALRALGVPAADAAEAVAQGRVALALVTQLLDVPRRYTLEEVAARSGVPRAVLRERYRALGIPEDHLLGEAELAEAEQLAELLQLIPPDLLIRVLRIEGQSLTRIGLAHLDLVYEAIVDPVRDAGGDDVAVALALVEAYRSLHPLSTVLLQRAYDRIIEQLLTSELTAQATRGTGEELVLSVGFADVVGYTSLSARVDPAGLEDVIEAFEARCYIVAGTADGVQLVKFLGDAAMFVATAPAPLATALLRLLERPDEVSALAGSPIRAGMAHGPVLARGGDYYGATVNLAARLTDRARAFRLLAEGGLADALEAFDLRRTPALHLRGIGRHRALSVHSPPAEG